MARPTLLQRLAPLVFLPAALSHAQSPIYTIDGVDDRGQLGFALAALDDLDGDGARDFGMAATFHEIVGGPNAGNLGAVEARSTRTGTLLWRLENDRTTGAFGSTLSSIEDVDGDGTGDLIVGHFLDSEGTMAFRGRVLLVSGATGAILREWFGDSAGDMFGAGIAAIPDRDGDGLDDIAASRPRLLNGGARYGTIDVYSSATGALLQTTDYPVGGPAVGRRMGRIIDLDGDGIDEWHVHIDLESTPVPTEGYSEIFSGATGQLLFELRGQFSRESFGWNMLRLPDFNGDGTEDLVVIAPHFEFTPEANLRVYVLSGADRSTLQVFEVPGESPGGLIISPTLIGDLDQDGFPDLALGLPLTEEPELQFGRIQVHSLITGLEIHRIKGTSVTRGLGSSTLATGDVNLDGIPDILAGAPGRSLAGVQGNFVGRVTLFAGPEDVRYSFCTPAFNSVGQRAELSATGSNSLTTNNLQFAVAGLPQNRFGIFVVSDTLRTPIMPPGSAGNLCLGGNAGRMNRSHEILSSGNAGTFQLGIDLTDLPLGGTFGSAVAAQTLFFQTWYRDLEPLPTNNFSDGMAVVVRP